MTVLVGQRRPRPQHALRHSAPLPSFPKYPQHPNFVIPRAVAESMHPWPQPPPLPKYPQNPNFVIPCAVAESISACQRINQRSQHPLHSTMDTATSRSMTVLCGVTVCAGTDDGVGRATASPPPTRSPSLRTPPVIPEVPAEPKLRHSAHSCGIHAPLPPTPTIPEVPAAPKLRHSARSRGIHLPPAKAPAREASTLCTPLWILRLRAV